MIAAWYDAAHPGLFLSGFCQVFPPATLLALLNADSTIEIWTAGQTSRIAGPVPFGMIADVAGSAFASASLAKAYLDGEFAKSPSQSGAPVFSFPVPASVWIMAHNLGRNPSVQLLTSGGLIMIGEVLHLSPNVAQASFDAPQSGSAIIT